MDGDMYDRRTSSGKPVGAKPHWIPGVGFRYDEVPFVMKNCAPKKTSILHRLRRAFINLKGK
jgi:hypothetical protein